MGDRDISSTWALLAPQRALAVGVLTSSIGVRVRRFFGFVLGGCRAGCCLRCRLMFSSWCVWASVRRFFGFVLDRFGGQQLSSM